MSCELLSNGECAVKQPVHDALITSCHCSATLSLPGFPEYRIIPPMKNVRRTPVITFNILHGSLLPCGKIRGVPAEKVSDLPRNR